MPHKKSRKWRDVTISNSADAEMLDKNSSKTHFVKKMRDVTISEFADAAEPITRLGKSLKNVKVVLKEEVEKTEEEKTEEDVEEEEVPQESDTDTSETEEIASVVIQKDEAQVITQLDSVAEKCRKDSIEEVYPLDVWFLISEYISPKDVGIFAAICRSSFQVVCSAKFWFRLYRRYYKSVPNLPEQLQPECLVREYGLRASVIRALHYMYDPFIQKRENKYFSRNFDDSSLLERYKCDLIWYCCIKEDSWVYYIKLRQKSNSAIHSRTNSSTPDVLRVPDDIFANPEENCKILQITCSYFVQVPDVFGLTLKSTSMNLSQNMRQYRLQLVFGSSINSTTKSADDAVLIFDPIVKIHVLNWWHPLYPYSHSTHNLDHEVSDSEWW
ncbi:transmembrane protein 183 [Cylas formicarius]|uniref:transmembrane protein 183 n=1 Tax=Cylas formicarius TaxID=197179 RepID=UPI002958A522|nr:transmembrane protein 183 [Cylas formicarius]XP_060524127.1 transmembrane protein 183 [Cylas formicarius]XP_060524128.1 transmembrane protein 183 [Cylas formicarius]XP_060524129.1 transmembrane protein 183 [Cylas formicarius]